MSKNLDILVLPMDDRPCTYDFPYQLGQMYGANIIMPDKNLLGNLERVAEPQKLEKWILGHSNNLDGIIISSDSLAYGGLIPSRRNYQSFDNIAQNFKIIKLLKEANKNIPVYVCSTILRISNSNENQEEKQYWKEYGQLIYNYSFLLHKNYLINEGDYDQYDCQKIINKQFVDSKITEIRSLIPDEIIQDYIDGRFRNFRINKLLLKLVKEKYIDFLSICADDSSQYGFNVIEKNIFNKIVENNPSIKDKVLIYPGTDEAVSCLMARMINKHNDFIPKFYPIYSDLSKLGNIVTMYEGIPLSSTLQSQIKAVGGKLVNSVSESDISIYLHSAEKNQEDQYLNAIYQKSTVQDLESSIDKELSYFVHNQSQNIALVDVAFANGGDNNFMNNLSKVFDLKKLITYSAWNTAGNSIGTALAHSSIRFLAKNNNDSSLDDKHFEFLFERFFDDWLYQGFTRLKFIENNGFPLDQEQLTDLSAYTKKVCQDFINNNLKNDQIKSIDITRVSFPWKRPFEIEIKCKVYC